MKKTQEIARKAHQKYNIPASRWTNKGILKKRASSATSRSLKAVDQKCGEVKIGAKETLKGGGWKTRGVAKGPGCTFSGGRVDG